jgi:hypothetical protein
MPVFNRRDEYFNHFSSNEVGLELVEFRQPGVLADVVRILGVLQIAESKQVQYGNSATADRPNFESVLLFRRNQ